MPKIIELSVAFSAMTRPNYLDGTTTVWHTKKPKNAEQGATKADRVLVD